MTALVGMICTSCRNGDVKPPFPEDSISFTTPSGKILRVACIFHGSLAFEYGGKVIHIDPVTQMGEMKIDYSAFGKADAIFITHAHPDHLCTQAIDSLSSENTALYGNAESVTALGRGTELANGDSGSCLTESGTWQCPHITPPRAGKCSTRRAKETHISLILTASGYMSQGIPSRLRRCRSAAAWTLPSFLSTSHIR